MKSTRLLLLSTALCGPAFAQTYTQSSGTNTFTNFSLPYLGNTTYALQGGTTKVSGSFTLSDTASPAYVFDYTGGHLNFTGSDQTMYVGAAGSGEFDQGNVTLDQANLTTIDVGGVAADSQSGLGTYNLTGGTLHVSTLNLDSASAFNNVGGTLKVQQTSIIDGATLSNTSGASVVNAGTVNNSGTFTVDATSSVSGSGTYTQSAGWTGIAGSLSQSTVNVQGGTLDIAAAATVHTTTLNFTGGTIRVDGELDPLSVDVPVGGVLEGTGLVDPPAFENAGTVILGDGPWSPGTLKIDGDFTQDASGVLVDTIDGSNGGYLNVTGTVTLGGTLDLYVGGTLTHDETVELLDPGAVSGSFSSLDVIGGPDDWTLIYGKKSVDLEYLGPSLAVPEPDDRLDLALLLVLAPLAALGRRRLARGV